MSRKSTVLFFVIYLTVFSPGWADELPYRPGELLVRFTPKPDARQRTISECNTVLASIGGGTVKHSYKLVSGLTLVKLPENLSVENALVTFKNVNGILYAEPNYKIYFDSTFPDDTRFDELWGMHNTDIATDSDVIVAVIDSGIDYEHPDLASNIWVNPGEIPDNGLDDDNNDYIDDIYGWNFGNRGDPPGPGPDPMDIRGHGTHVAGTIGAVGNNEEGVVGVCWNVKMMALNIDIVPLDWDAFCSAAIEAIDYAVDNGAGVLNASWYIESYSQSLKNTIGQAGASMVLFVSSAGNNGNDNDGESPQYPASYDLDNIISVMATDQSDLRAVWTETKSSNYGATSVDLAAPGSDILSCKREDGYEPRNGTSQSTPHVAGACALVWSVNASLSHLEVRGIILSTVDELEALEGLCVTEGRLNIHRAVDAASHYARAFCVKDSSDVRVAWFDNFGNLFLKGSLTQGEGQTRPTATGDDEFIFKDSSGNLMIINTTNGNMYIYGSQQSTWESPSAESDEFIIENSSGPVAYISDSGDLYLKGKLYQNPGE